VQENRETGNQKCPAPSGRARLRECSLVSLAKMQAEKSKVFTVSKIKLPSKTAFAFWFLSAFAVEFIAIAVVRLAVPA